ncbi:MAG: hypothetical protein Q9166_004077 [cf. Caloplaca sp. 2 TL-2023]
MAQTHDTGRYFVKFRPVQWESQDSVDAQIDLSTSSATQNLEGNHQFNLVRSAALGNTQQSYMKTQSRRFSMPVSPTTTNQRKHDTDTINAGNAIPLFPVYHPVRPTHQANEPHIGNLNSFGRQVKAFTPTPPSRRWRPFHVFSTGPATPNVLATSLIHAASTSTSTPASTPEGTISRQHWLFRVTADVCTHAAQEYLRSQRLSSSSQSPDALHLQCPSNQGYHPYNNDRTSQEQQQSYSEGAECGFDGVYLTDRGHPIRTSKIRDG